MPLSPALVNPPAEAPASSPAVPKTAAQAFGAHRETNNEPITNNNYARPAGQNVGNFLTDRYTFSLLTRDGIGINGWQPADPLCFAHYMRLQHLKVVCTTEVGFLTFPKSRGLIEAGGTMHCTACAQACACIQDVHTCAHARRNSSRVLAPPGGASQVSMLQLNLLAIPA